MTLDLISRSSTKTTLNLHCRGSLMIELLERQRIHQTCLAKTLKQYWWLRKRYNKLFSEICNKDEIFVRSTDVDRTLMSFLCNLAGLYQPEASDVWNPNANWQPIPVHTMPEFGYLFNYLSKYTGRSMNSLEDLQRFKNILYIKGLYNKTLPEWTKKVYRRPALQFLSDSTFTIGTYNLAQLKTGPLIKEVLQRFTD
ncbi:hypothetical protein GQX74_009538 [Glossina fuscipes]|nr:hypothetical protein GQX74_009538 [Glossina fuscipes]